MQAVKARRANKHFDGNRYSFSLCISMFGVVLMRFSILFFPADALAINASSSRKTSNSSIELCLICVFNACL